MSKLSEGKTSLASVTLSSMKISTHHLHKLHECMTQVCKPRLVVWMCIFFVVRKKYSNHNGQFNSTKQDPLDFKTYERFPNKVFFNT